MTFFIVFSKNYNYSNEGIAEVDFLVAHDGEILPLEVKRGLNRAIKSLWVYADKFNPHRVYSDLAEKFRMPRQFRKHPPLCGRPFPPAEIKVSTQVKDSHCKLSAAIPFVLILRPCALI